MKQKMKKKMGAGHRGCQPIIEVIVKMQNKNKLGEGLGRGGRGWM